MSGEKSSKISHFHGFTLIELVVALLIVCLLIMVVVASVYDHQAHKSKRKAIHRMHEVADWLHLQRGARPGFAEVLPRGWSEHDQASRYTYSLVARPVRGSDPKVQFPAVGENTFTVRATPDDEDACGDLLLDQDGRRGVTGPGASVAACWE